MGKLNYNPDTEIADLSGKVYLITGGTNGIGKQCVLALAKHSPSHIYFTGRNDAAGAAVISAAKAVAPAVDVTFLKCDLGDRASIKAAFANFTSPRLDVYLACAGVMALPPGTTADGYEVHFGTNHMGHAAIMKLVLPIMLHTSTLPGADVRFVSVSSQGYGFHPSGGIVFDSLHSTQEQLTFARWVLYSQSKLANILYAREMAKRYPQITSLSLHPGVVKTDLVGNLGIANKLLVYVTNPAGLLTPEEGAYNTLWAATTAKENLKQGAYYEPVGDLKETGLRMFNDDGTLATKLWEWTEQELSAFGQ